MGLADGLRTTPCYFEANSAVGFPLCDIGVNCEHDIHCQHCQEVCCNIVGARVLMTNRRGHLAQFNDRADEEDMSRKTPRRNLALAFITYIVTALFEPTV